MSIHLGDAAAAHPARSETYYFDGWRFNERDGRIGRNGNERSLRPKTAGVLRGLVSRAGDVVTKSDLLAEVWGDAAAGDDVLAVCVNELRRLLGDDPHRPRFIETAHRRGYRFVAPVSRTPAVRAPDERPLIGRGRELATLRAWWETARGNRRVVGFVAGELGIGKTALLRTFAADVRAEGGAVIGEGRCVERVAGGEPYSPFLDALNGMCRAPGGRGVREVLWHHAPSWLLQLPGLLDEDEAAQLRARTGASMARVSFGRMLREFSDALSVLGGDAPVLLVCEDLDSGDPASVDLVASFAAASDAGGRILLMATFREPDGRAGPRVSEVARDLTARDVARVLELGPLDESAVRAVLERRLGGVADAVVVTELARRSEGNALYLTMLVDQVLASDGAGPGEGLGGDPSGDSGIPEGLRHLVVRQLALLESDDVRLLESASIVGVEFTAAAVRAADAGGSGPIDHVEARLARLADRHDVVRELDPVTWPDGTATARFRFVHELHRDVLQDRVSRAGRSVAHRRIGERLAIAFADSPGAAAADVAMHFERGHDPVHAVVWLGHAAETAMKRHAPQAALASTSRALELMVAAPGTTGGESTGADPVRSMLAATAVRLRTIRVTASISVFGVGSEEVAVELAELDRASVLLEDPVAVGRIAYVLWSVGLMRGHLRSAHAHLARLTAAAQQSGDDALRLRAASAQAATAISVGDPVGARAFIDRGLALDSPEVRPRLAGFFQDSGVLCRTFGALDDWLLGFPDRARVAADDVLRLTRADARPDGLCQALWPVATLFQLCGDVARVRELADELIDLARSHDLPVWLAGGLVLRGWAEIDVDPAGAVDRIREGLGALGAGSDGLWRSYHLSLLAEAESAAGSPGGAVETIDHALRIAEGSGEQWYLAELLRLRADLGVRAARATGPRQRCAAEEEAERLFRRSLEVARTQGSRAFELRTLASLDARARPERSRPSPSSRVEQSAG